MADFERTPEGEFIIPKKVAAQLAGVAEPTLTGWMREPDAPPISDCGGFPAKQFGNWIRQKQILKKGRMGRMTWLPPGVVMTQNGGEGSAKSLNDVKIRKETAMAEKVERENMVESGQLLPVADVERAWGNILSRVKTRLLKVPFAAAQVVVGDDDMVSVQGKIKDFVAEALTELSTDWREGAEDEQLET